jgi:acetyl-CoA carboxylase biotin carboxyl carrier protein
MHDEPRAEAAIAPAVPQEAPGADGPSPRPAGTSSAYQSSQTVGIIALIDRLEDLLERSELAELEVQAGELGIMLRKPGPLLPGGVGDAGAGSAAGTGGPGAMPGTGQSGAAAGAKTAETRHHRVVAPLTGIYYSSPSPGAAPYIKVGADVVVGQVIGLIEAMKLFNEIKSDAAGRVVRIVAEHGKLVKAKQPLVEIEPT